MRTSWTRLRPTCDRAELFGPVTVVVPSGDDEAMRVANATLDHLPAAVFGRHIKDQHGASTPGFATCYGRPCRFGGKIRRPRQAAKPRPARWRRGRELTRRGVPR